MKTTNEEDLEAGPSSDVGGDLTSTTAGNNGRLVMGTGGGGGGNLSPHPPASPNPTENLAARARMSAVLQLWTGRGHATRAKSLDIGDDHLPRHQFRHKRNSLVSASNSAIQAAATTAATAAAAATASCGSYDDPPVSLLTADQHSSFSSDDDVISLRHKLLVTPSASVDNPMLDPVSPVSIRLPHIGSARYVQLAASIPEDTDETEDGACVGGKFKVTERKKVTTSSSLPSSWSDDKQPPPPTSSSPQSAGDATTVAPLTQENVAALADGSAATTTSKSKDSDTTDSIQGRVDNSSGRNSLADSRAAVVGTETLLVPSRPRPLQRQLSQDLDRQYDPRLSRTSSLATEDSDTPLQAPVVADIH